MTTDAPKGALAQLSGDPPEEGIWRDWSPILAGRTSVIGNDHPFSQGYQLYILSAAPHARKTVRCTRAQMRAWDTVDSGGRHFSVSGLHADILLIGWAVDRVRLIELITHETSHWIDTLFERCVVKNVDTELRAYYLDWAVGKAVRHFNLDKK